MSTAQVMWRTYLEGVRPFPGWDLGPQTAIEVAQRTRNEAAQEHDRASANRARVAVIPGVTATNVGQARQRLINARSALYAADAKLAALVREADVKARIEEVEEIKRETLAKIEAAIDILIEGDAGEDVASTLNWDFLDTEAEEDVAGALMEVLRDYRRRVDAS